MPIMLHTVIMRLLLIKHSSFAVYLILGQFHEHIGLMLSLYNRGLLNDGNLHNFFVVVVVGAVSSFTVKNFI